MTPYINNYFKMCWTDALYMQLIPMHYFYKLRPRCALYSVLGVSTTFEIDCLNKSIENYHFDKYHIHAFIKCGIFTHVRQFKGYIIQSLLKPFILKICRARQFFETVVSQLYICALTLDHASLVKT